VSSQTSPRPPETATLQPRPYPWWARALSWLLRTVSILVVLLAGWLLMQSFRAVFDPANRPLLRTTRPPTDDHFWLPPEYQDSLSGDWSIREPGWMLRWQPQAHLPTGPLSRRRPASLLTSLESSVLGWLASTGSPQGPPEAPVYLLTLGSLIVEAPLSEVGPKARLLGFRVLQPLPTGNCWCLEAEPLAEDETTAEQGTTPEEPLCPRPEGIRPLATRRRPAGPVLAELVPLPADDLAWRNQLLREGWDWSVAAPEPGYWLQKGTTKLRLWPLVVPESGPEFGPDPGAEIQPEARPQAKRAPAFTLILRVPEISRPTTEP